MNRWISIMVVCTIIEALQVLRPGAQWVIQGTDFGGLTWLDKIQAKPTQTEVNNTIAQCQANVNARNNQKTQARFEVKSSTVSIVQKLQDLILLLDLDQ